MKPILLLFLLLAAACKHSSSSSASAHTETSTTTESSSSETGNTTTTTIVTEAPGETTTTTEEFGPPEKETAAPEEAAAGGTPESGASPGRTKPTIPRHGPLVKRTVTVTKSGGEKTETVQQATSQGTTATETKAAGKVDVQAKAAEASAPSVSCVSLGWLWGVALIAAMVIGWRVLRKV